MSRPQVYQFHHAAALCLYLLLPPGVLCVNLLCFYSPIIPREEHYDLILSECPPRQQCTTADGCYGNHSVLASRGCMAAEDCGKPRKVRLRGTTYTMHYSCCDWNYCNSCPCVQAKCMPYILTMVAVAWLLASL